MHRDWFVCLLSQIKPPLMLISFSDGYLSVMGLLWLVVILAFLFLVYSQAWRSRRKSVQLFAKAACSLWILLFVAVLLETSFALFYDTTDSFAMTNTTRRWYRRYVQHNNLGYRDRKDFTRGRTSASHRVVLLGDSFSFGHGISDPRDRFGDRLEARCVEASDGEWELYNISQPGLPATLMAETVRQLEEQSFEMDTLLLVYNLNDIEDLDDDSKVIIGTIILDQPSHWLIRDSYLPNFLYYRTTHFTRPEVQGYFDWLADAYEGDAWEQLCVRFDSIRDVCNRRNVNLVVVIFPLLHGLDGDYRFTSVHERLREYWTGHEVKMLDLLETFQAHRSETLTVNRFDAHPNERAHAIAARAIWEDLFQDQLAATHAAEPER